METNAAAELHVVVVHRQECTHPPCQRFNHLGSSTHVMMLCVRTLFHLPSPTQPPAGARTGAVVGLTSHSQCRTDCCTVGHVGQSAHGPNLLVRGIPESQIELHCLVQIACCRGGPPPQCGL